MTVGTGRYPHKHVKGKRTIALEAAVNVLRARVPPSDYLSSGDLGRWSNKRSHLVNLCQMSGAELERRQQDLILDLLQENESVESIHEALSNLEV